MLQIYSLKLVYFILKRKEKSLCQALNKTGFFFYTKHTEYLI